MDDLERYLWNNHNAEIAAFKKAVKASIGMVAERINKGGFMSKHTPGPWVMLPEECDKTYIRIRGSQLGGRYKIANVITPIYENVHEREAKETRANAALIAAAPELLDALVQWRNAEKEFDGVEMVNARISRNLAISKATGGNNDN